MLEPPQSTRTRLSRPRPELDNGLLIDAATTSAPRPTDVPSAGRTHRPTPPYEAPPAQPPHAPLAAAVPSGLRTVGAELGPVRSPAVAVRRGRDAAGAGRAVAARRVDS